MPYTARTDALLRKMKPGMRVLHHKHGKGTVQPDPPEHFQLLVRFDELVDGTWRRVWVYPDNLDILPQNL